MAVDRRTAIARTLRDELGMTHTSIGDYLGVHVTSAMRLYKYGNTSQKKPTPENPEYRGRRSGA